MASLSQKHPLLANCFALNPPALNPEVKASISSAHLSRDTSYVTLQSQIGKTLTPLGRTTNLLLAEGEADRKGLLADITDASRLLAHTFFVCSQVRRSLLLPSFDKPVKDLVESTGSTTLLFGEEDLGERLRQLKFIFKVGKDLQVAPATRSIVPFPAKKGGGEQFAGQQLPPTN